MPCIRSFGSCGSSRRLAWVGFEGLDSILFLVFSVRDNTVAIARRARHLGSAPRHAVMIVRIMTSRMSAGMK